MSVIVILTVTGSDRNIIIDISHEIIALERMRERTREYERDSNCLSTTTQSAKLSQSFVQNGFQPPLLAHLHISRTCTGSGVPFPCNER